MKNITVGALIDKLKAVEMIDGCTKVLIRDEEFNVIAGGTLPDDGIAMYRNYQVEEFTWDCEIENKCIINIVSNSDIITTVNTIDELIKRMKNEELERCRLGKEITGACGLIEHWYNRIKDEDYITRHLYDEMYGALNGLFAAYYISSQEFNKLTAELTEIYK